MSSIRTVLGFGLILALLAAPMSAPAVENYPSRPIRIIVPYPPGGNTDLVARHFAQRLTEMLGNSVVIDNRGGAGGAVGATAAAHADPDGYTILHATNSELALLPAVQANMPYDVLKAFAPITTSAIFPFVVVVRKDLPVHSMKDLVELARQKPGMLTFGSAGIGTGNHLILEPFKSVFNIDVVHVPYKGGGPVVNDLLGGHLDASFATLSSILSQVQSGQLPALMVTGDKRSSLLPDVPSAAELGYPDLVVLAWNAFLAPAGTPNEVLDKLHDAMVAAGKDPDLVKRIADAGAEVQTSTPEQLTAFIKSDIARWSKVAKEKGIKID